MTTDLPAGITRETPTTYLVEVRVRPYPKRRKRFPATTPVDVLIAWRASQVAELTQARRDLERATTAAADPLLPARARVASVGTFADDVETYIRDKMRPTLHPCTRLQFSRWLRQAATTDLGRYPRQLVTGGMLTTLLASWERAGIPGHEDAGGRKRIIPPGPLAPYTCNKIRTCWIGFYDAMNVGLDLPNPARRVPRRKTGDPEPRGIAMGDALAIIAAIPPGTRTAARLTLMAVLGLRPVEIMRIKPATDWAREARQLHVRTAKRGKGRTLPLCDRAVAALEALETLKGWGTFTSAPAARMFHDAVRVAKLTALEPLVPYDLRHSFGTEAYRLTKDIKATAAAMGHRNLSQTERYVEAAVAQNVASLYDQVAAAMPKPPKKTKTRGTLRAVK